VSSSLVTGVERVYLAAVPKDEAALEI